MRQPCASLQIISARQLHEVYPEPGMKCLALNHVGHRGTLGLGTYWRFIFWVECLQVLGYLGAQKFPGRKVRVISIFRLRPHPQPRTHT
jgi:hypothetical protein